VDSNDDASEKTVEEPNDIYDNYVFDASRDGDEGNTQYEWNLVDLPGAARITCGPMTFELLVEKTQIDEDIVSLPAL
jgi:hypothetical protein